MGSTGGGGCIKGSTGGGGCIKGSTGGGGGYIGRDCMIYSIGLLWRLACMG